MIAQRYKSGARVSKHAVADYAGLGRERPFPRSWWPPGRALSFGRTQDFLGPLPAAAPQVVASAPAELKPTAVPPAPPAVQAATATPSASAPDAKPAKEAPASPVEPAFDVVNVDPSGDAVIAGRAAPNAKVELRDAGKRVADVTADASGQFVIIPPALAPGDHSLSLAASDDKAEPETSKTVAVSVPAPEAKAPRLPPRRLRVRAARLPAPPVQAMRTVATPARVAGARVAIQSVEADAAGGLVAKGSADPNATVRLYLNDAGVADARTQSDGRWSLTIQHGMTPGGYLLRADEINPSDATRCCERQHPVRLSGGAGARFACRPRLGLRKPSAIVRGLAGRPDR